VANWDWDFGTLQTTHPSSGAPLTVDNFGRLSYPTDGSGGALPPVASGDFPLVVFGHGRLGTGPDNHLQAAYLMDHLASWGIIATSVSLDVVGQFSFPAAIPQRGDIILVTLDRHLNLALQPGTPPQGLAAAIDATRIGLAGHSRGGEGVADALVKNAASGIYDILAAATIAPTDYEQYTLPADIPYLGLYGSKDGDVNNGWPIYLHDRGDSTEKVFEYVHGANHFWFTESITYSGEGSADISRQLHHDIAEAYITGFMVQKLIGNGLESSVFADGPEMNPLTSIVDILPMYRHPDRWVVDDFEANPSLGQASSGGNVINSFPKRFEISFDDTGLTLYHKTKGGVSGWNAGTSHFAVALPGGGFDASGWENLSGKFAQRLDSPFNTAFDQDARVVLRDLDGDLAFVDLSAHGRIIKPITHTGGLFQNFPKKTVLRTTRIPLTAFTAAEPLLDLDRLTHIGWQSVNATGEIEFDDLEFTR
jgi:fermentation-respiration switch protein FrsA (DUF1100 family)